MTKQRQSTRSWLELRITFRIRRSPIDHGGKLFRSKELEVAVHQKNELQYQEALNHLNYHNLIILGVVPDAGFSSMGYYLFLFPMRYIKQKEKSDLFQQTNAAKDV